MNATSDKAVRILPLPGGWLVVYGRQDRAGDFVVAARTPSRSYKTVGMAQRSARAWLASA